jgi:membrane protein YdbS with pleckstrin-like domain
MYCHNCGKDVRNSANFCDNCGSPQIGPGEKADENRPLLTVRPFFSPPVTFIKQIPFQILFALWGAAVFGIAGYFIVKYLELNIHPWFFAWFFGIIIFVFTPIVFIFTMLNRYAKTEYRFYKNRLECSEGVMTAGEMSIGYEAILEVNLVRGIVQRIFHLGTIMLSTAATRDLITHSRRRILLIDIEHPEIAYQKIKHLIGG